MDRGALQDVEDEANYSVRVFAVAHPDHAKHRSASLRHPFVRLFIYATERRRGRFPKLSPAAEPQESDT